jgi:hypothetical protein
LASTNYSIAVEIASRIEGEDLEQVRQGHSIEFSRQVKEKFPRKEELVLKRTSDK